MEVLKPEVYWIGNRCYRMNPCQGQGQQGQNNYYSVPDGEDEEEEETGTGGAAAPPPLKPYVEVDEFEDTAMVADEDLPDQNLEIIKEDNGFKVYCSVPSSLFPHIIGTKGNVRKRIEMETRTRVIVPRPNEKGDIAIRGQNEADVRKAFQRIDQIAFNARFKRDATHFACFPMNDPGIVKKAKEFKEAVLQNCTQNSRGLDQNVFQEPEKLHLTIGIMVLLDERERKSAADILASLEPEIRQLTEGKPLKIQLKGLEIMNDDPAQVDVLYAKCDPLDGGTAIQEVANLIARKFSEKQLGKASKGEQVKLHCTIINTRYRIGSKNNDGASSDNRRQDSNNRWRNNGSYNSRESFDARSILQKYGDFDFGTVNVTEVKIATRHTKGPDGFYKCYTSFSI